MPKKPPEAPIAGPAPTPCSPASIACCWPRLSLAPEAPKTLMPLSSGGLWLADTIRPPAAPRRRMAPGIAGVGHRPKVHTSLPAAVSPAVSAATSIGPLLRESMPMSTGAPWGNTWPHQKPTCKAKAGLTWVPTRPRMPSVPKPATPPRRGRPTGWGARSAMGSSRCLGGAQATWAAAKRSPWLAWAR